jgi:hypothetical protein
MLLWVKLPVRLRGGNKETRHENFNTGRLYIYLGEGGREGGMERSVRVQNSFQFLPGYERNII